MKILRLVSLAAMILPVSVYGLDCLSLKAIKDDMKYEDIIAKIGQPMSKTAKKENQYIWESEGVSFSIMDFGTHYSKSLFGYNKDNRDICKLCIAFDSLSDESTSFPMEEIKRKIGPPNQNTTIETTLSRWEIDEYSLDVESTKVPVQIEPKTQNPQSATQNASPSAPSAVASEGTSTVPSTTPALTFEEKVIAVIQYGVCIDENAPEVEKLPYSVPRLRNKESIEAEDLNDPSDELND